jgi:uncharacterized membrane protein
MRMTTSSKGMLMATAAAVLFLSGAVKAGAAETKATGDKVRCSGINECKGHGACKSAANACAGQNGCKGQGVVETSKAECDKKGGKVVQ